MFSAVSPGTQAPRLGFVHDCFSHASSDLKMSILISGGAQPLLFLHPGPISHGS